MLDSNFDVFVLQPAASEEQKKMQKASSSVELGKSDSLRKNSQDGRFASSSWSPY